MAARLYDKTAEIARRELAPDLWGEERAADCPVWRLEFQVRRKVLGEFQLRTGDEVLGSVQDLWRYGTAEWLTLRVPTGDRRERRWPLDPLRRGVQAVTIVPAASGVVRRPDAPGGGGAAGAGPAGLRDVWAAPGVAGAEGRPAPGPAGPPPAPR